MSAHYVSPGLPVQPSVPVGRAGRWTLRLSVAGALLLAVAEFAVLRQYPEAAEPADPVAMASFGRAALDQFALRSAAPHAAFAGFDVRPRAVAEENRP